MCHIPPGPTDSKPQHKTEILSCKNFLFAIGIILGLATSVFGICDGLKMGKLNSLDLGGQYPIGGGLAIISITLIAESCRIINKKKQSSCSCMLWPSFCC